MYIVFAAYILSRNILSFINLNLPKFVTERGIMIHVLYIHVPYFLK
uniref:Uncharacterized protein n=1 Tax=Amphimedon queenslandica TaxID=400682 RepID=A0A1X7TXM6_AMPQE